MVAAITKPGRQKWRSRRIQMPTRLTEAEEERLPTGIEYHQSHGQEAAGYRAVGSASTLDLILKKGFPRVHCRRSTSRTKMSRGKNTGLVELAIDWTSPKPSWTERQDAVAGTALSAHRDEFDGAMPKVMFVLTLHPYLSGHRAPMKHLDEFVAAEIEARRLFATGTIAQYVKTQTPR
jgi:hypothetical protein